MYLKYSRGKFYRTTAQSVEYVDDGGEREHQAWVQLALKILVNLTTILLATTLFCYLLSDARTNIAKSSQNFNLVPHSASQTRLQPRTDKCSLLNGTGNYYVPNIVHYSWYKKPGVHMGLQNYLSILSVANIVKPKAIRIHTNITIDPQDHYWHMATKLKLVKVVKVRATSGKKRPGVLHSHHLDLVIQGGLPHLINNGGIYIHADILVLKNLDQFRRFPCTVSKSSFGKANRAVVVCCRNSPFLHAWDSHLSYDRNPQQWLQDAATKFNNVVAKMDKDNLRLEPRLDVRTRMNLWTSKKKYDWQTNHVIRYVADPHNHTEPTLHELTQMNNTIGEITRFILHK